MSRTLTIELPDEVFEALQQTAAATGQAPAAWAVARLEALLPQHNGQANGPMNGQPTPFDERTLTERYAAAKAQLPLEAVEGLTRVALHYGLPPEKYIIDWVERMPKGPPPGVTQEEWDEGERRLQRHCGAVSGGDPYGSDNEKIDADLARYYADDHEDED